MEEQRSTLLIRALDAHARAVGDPKGAAVDAEELVGASRAAGDHPAQVAALRALAEARRLEQRSAEAAALLNRASRIARQHVLDDRLGEVLLTRGVVRLESGRTRAARADFEAAARLLGESRATEVDIRRAALAQNAGRLEAAAALYEKILNKANVAASVRTRAANNLGLIEATLGRHNAAARRLRQAAAFARSVGHAYVAQVTETRAAVAVQAGRLTEGVARFDEAIALWREAGLPLGELYTDYADALSHLRLLPEARVQAEQAAAELAAHGVPLMAVSAQLRVASLALAMGDAESAERLAEETAASARRQRLAVLRARSNLVAIEARIASRRPSQTDHTAAVRAAGALASAAMPQFSADGYLIAGRVAAALDRPAKAVADWHQAAELAPGVPVLARVTSHLACALTAELRHDDAALLRACRTGLRDLARHRAALPSTELRALASGHGSELSALGLGAVLRTRSPAQVLAWMERTRANALSAVEPGPDEGLGDELGALRAVQTEIVRARRTDRTELPALLTRQSEIEARIRHNAWTESRPTIRMGRQFSASALRGALGGRTLVEYDVYDGRLVAAVVDERRTRLVRLGALATVESEIDELRSALQALNVCVPEMAAFLHDTATALIERLVGLLVEPLEIRSRTGVVVVPIGELQRVPWSAMFDCPVSVAPSATLWMDTSRRSPPDAPVVLAAGPELEWAVAEVEALARRYGDARVLTPPESSVDLVRSALDGASLAHLSCHGQVRADNPTFSSLLLSDGSLTVHELDRRAGAPHRMVLAACDVGGSVTFPGNEVLGFIGTLLTRGTAGVVASTMLVLDRHVTPLMLALHEGVRSGQTLSEALFAARRQVDLSDQRAYPAWCTFTAYGAA